MDNKPVIVGVDGAEDSVRALRWAATHAGSVGAPLHAYGVFEVPAMHSPYGMAAWENPENLEKNMRTVLADTIAKALGEDAQVEQKVLQGHPAKVLVEHSGEAGLLVIGSRGRGAFAGMLLGSVSQYVVARAKCPVVVMPTHSED